MFKSAFRTLSPAILTLFMLLPALTFGQDKTPQPSATLLADVLHKAKAQHKTALVIFHASWCGWCKRLDAALQIKENQKIMEANYVILHLDVMENGSKKAELENPGADKDLDRLGGAKSGLPFYAFLDSQGKKLADSNVMPNNQNIGYPGSPEEITAFGKLLQQTAPHLASDQLNQVIGYFRQNAPKQ